MQQEDLQPDRLVAEYRCGRPRCGTESVWRKSFPDSAFPDVAEMERFLRDHVLRGIEKRCGSCKSPLRKADLKRAEYSCWSGRVGQELILEMLPRRGRLRTTYPIRRLFLRRGADREEVESPHDPRLRSVMADSILRAGALLSEEPGQSEKGTLLIRQAIEMDPDHFMGHARLDEALYRDGRVEEAEESLRAALRGDATCEPALELLARICHSSGRWAEAETYSQRASVATGGRLDLALGEARAQVRLGRVEEAYLTCADLLRHRSSPLEALRLCGILSEDIDPDRSETLLKRLIEAASDRNHQSLRALAQERLLLLALPRFRPRVGEESEAALARLDKELRAAGFSASRWEVRGKKAPGRKTTVKGKTVYLNVFPGRFDEPERAALVDWLLLVRQRSKTALVQVCTALPCPYTVRRLTSRLPEAALDLHSERLADPQDPGSSAAALVDAFDELPDPPSREGLEVVDRILLEKYFDDGFGDIRPATAILFAHYAGEAMRKIVGGEWAPGDPIRILQTPEGGVDLLTKVTSLVTNGEEDSIAYLLETITP
ncbi:MAG: hypothetical protein O6952_07200 [Planctomycetota bacterium]|nr:hypothetical protein [Planctomycetota bacterium]